MNARDALKINRTVFNAVLAPLIVAAVLDLAAWGWWLHAGHAEQENHLTSTMAKFPRCSGTAIGFWRSWMRFCGSFDRRNDPFWTSGRGRALIFS